MKRIYIAGQITGLPETDWQRNFSEARAEVKALEAEPVCPTLLPHNHGKTWEEYMDECLRALRTCDAVYAQRNWQDSKGATIEVLFAQGMGLEIIYQACEKAKEVAL